ncbi:MAG: AI-2E family transporter [Ruminococcus sp.]|nr:AI-2E family transporter [Ruminococcus sp.]
MMKKKHNNPYIYAGLTAIAVISFTMLLVFIIFRHKELSTALNALSKALQPVVIGCIIAYLLAPVCNRFERLFKRFLPKTDRGGHAASVLGVVFSSLTALAVIVVLISLIVPATFNSLVSLITSVPDYVLRFIDWANKKLADYPMIYKYLMNAVDTVYDRFSKWTQDQFMPSMQTLLSGVGSGIGIALQWLLNIVIGFIVAIYLLSSKRLFAKQGKMTLFAAFRPGIAEKIYEEILYADKMFSGFLRGKLLDSTLVGLICFIVLRIMGYQDVVLISVIIGVTNIIPFFGPFIGAIPCALIVFVTDPKKCLYFIIFILILQQFDGNILGPKCMGSSINLSAFWVLFAILLFGRLFGFMGMLLGVPLFAVIYDILKKVIYYRLHKNGRDDLLPVKKTKDEGTDPPETAEKAAAEASAEVADEQTGAAEA